VLVLVNPRAGQYGVDGEVRRFQDIATRGGFHVTTLSDLAQAAAMANQWWADGRLRALVGVGGDGTARELVTRTNPGVPITLLAAGTGNVVARHFGLPRRARELYNVIARGRVLPIDAGSAAGRLFLAMVGCGLDAEVVRRLHRGRLRGSGHISYWSYVKPILESVRSYCYPEIQVRVYCGPPGAGPSHATVARWAVVCNLPRYGWGLPLAPWTDPRDGLLDVCAFDRGSWWNGLRYLAAVQLGIHRRLPDCFTSPAGRVRLEADRPVGYQLDGDPGGVLPVDIEVLPGRVSLLVPAREALGETVRRPREAGGDKQGA
jgi:diacylglycerol kinase family enzyme